MFARLLATFCLVLGVVVPVSSAQSAGVTDATLVVYLRTGGGQPAAPLAEMKREVASLMSQAGYRMEWRSLDGPRGEEGDASMLVVLELNGSCGLAAGYGTPEKPLAANTSLATTSITDRQVMPFSTLNCTALTSSVSASLAQEAGARRDFLYGRAMARVVAHELYHVFTNTTKHAAWGVAKAFFTSKDLVSDQFEFQEKDTKALRSGKLKVLIRNRRPPVLGFTR